jgi:hypothetical protein
MNPRIGRDTSLFGALGNAGNDVSIVKAVTMLQEEKQNDES